MTVRTAHYRILYRDIDSMGYLYYGRYMALFELGRVEWMRDEGWRYRDFEQQLGLMLPVTRTWCRHLAPLVYDDLARIQTWIDGWSTATVRFGHEVYSQESGQLCATGSVELGCVDRDRRRPARLPAAFQELLQRVAGDRGGRKRGV
ncbi:MAG: acyl-CoA thioesterase [Planctomycetota bacterium]|nr:MAG: acyl-CoA thioesterase [Planctomycetota bacterium]